MNDLISIITPYFRKKKIYSKNFRFNKKPKLQKL